MEIEIFAALTDDFPDQGVGLAVGGASTDAEAVSVVDKGGHSIFQRHDLIHSSLRYFPWKFGARFSRKAEVASFWSSVAHSLPMHSASKGMPERRFFSASMTHCLA